MRTRTAPPNYRQERQSHGFWVRVEVTYHRDLDTAEEFSDQAVDVLHALLCRPIGSFNHLVGVMITSLLGPVCFQDLLIRRDHGKDPRDATCGSNECGGTEAQYVRRRDDIDIVGRASPHGRIWALLSRADQAARCFSVGKRGAAIEGVS